MKSLLLLTLCGLALAALPQHASASENDLLLIGAVAQAGKHSNRDMVVVDRNKTIIADSICQNIGTKYPHDSKNEVTATLADGKTRTFVEKSVDYPKGIKETVYAVKNGKGQILGALIVSTVPLK